MGIYRGLSDEAVLRRMEELALDERKAIAESIACLGEVERRKLYSDLGYSDIFDYCVSHLRYSIGSAYRRIHSSRAADAHPEILSDLQAGTLTLCVVALIAPEFRSRNPVELLAAARGKSKREVESWLAARRPAQPVPPDRVTVRPPAVEPPPSGAQAGPAPLALEDRALAPKPPTFEYSFVASADLHQSIERLKNVLWNRFPFGALDDFLGEVVGEYLSRHDPELKLRAAAPPPVPVQARAGRRVAGRLRDAVWARDGGRCAFVSEDGRRCECRRGLELDHVVPFSIGGRSDDPANIRLLCREHNQRERRRLLGEGELALIPRPARGAAAEVIPKIPPVENWG
ncbi:MAG: HNH endonuclease signature motif containing protein [Elusimicrobia bacterium]|nr:HNH endonuclease signature motif containing protein [Elusimicrobiota bacterium]